MSICNLSVNICSAGQGLPVPDVAISLQKTKLNFGNTQWTKNKLLVINLLEGCSQKKLVLVINY